MAICDWPAAERPREKLLARGAAALSDSELVALFLGTGIRGTDAVELARSTLGRFGGLRGLLGAGPNEFCAQPGMGRARYALLQAGLELARRHLYEEFTGADPLTSPAQAERYLLARLHDRPHEVFCCLFLDSQHRVVACEDLFRGTLDGASVYPREVVKRALHHNAGAVIIAHNHPSGMPEPSAADRHITRRLVDALALVEVRVLDHVVVGRGRVVSFARRGWI